MPIRPNLGPQPPGSYHPLVVYMVEIPTTFRAPSARRLSAVIRRKPAANLWHAFNFAADLGNPLNTFVTINFAHTTCSPDDMSLAFRTLLDRKFGRWWRTRVRSNTGPNTPAYVWVAENTNGHPGIHWALHVPNRRRVEFATLLAPWLQSVAGTILSAAAIHVQDALTTAGLRRYMLKGVEPA